MSDLRIMVVEDEPITAWDLKDLLGELGYRVAAVVSGPREALEEAGRGALDLVLMDIGLGDSGDGIELAVQLQQRFGVGIIYLTGHGEPEIRARAELTQPLGYVVKPFEDHDIKTALEVALCKHQARCKARAGSRPFVIGAEFPLLPQFSASTATLACPMQRFCLEQAEAR